MKINERTTLGELRIELTKLGCEAVRVLLVGEYGVGVALVIDKEAHTGFGPDIGAAIQHAIESAIAAIGARLLKRGVS